VPSSASCGSHHWTTGRECREVWRSEKAVNLDTFEVFREVSIKTVSLQGCEAVFICDLLPTLQSSLLPGRIL